MPAGFGTKFRCFHLGTWGNKHAKPGSFLNLAPSVCYTWFLAHRQEGGVSIRSGESRLIIRIRAR